jgi:hypothetical protein
VHSSQELYDTMLPAATRERGLRWIERDTIVLGSVAIVGSMVWYDYSAGEPTRGRDEDYYASIKCQVSNDAHWVDWHWSDIEIACQLRELLASQLQACESDPNIDKVVVVTHVPVFEQQLQRDPTNLAWSIANAYFGNLRTGGVIAQFPKVRVVVSGHLHMGMRALVARKDMPEVSACVVGSDYGAPSWLTVEV